MAWEPFKEDALGTGGMGEPELDTVLRWRELGDCIISLQQTERERERERLLGEVATDRPIVQPHRWLVHNSPLDGLGIISANNFILKIPLHGIQFAAVDGGGICTALSLRNC